MSGGLALRRPPGDDGPGQRWRPRRHAEPPLRVEHGGADQLADTLELLGEHLRHLQGELVRCEAMLQLAQRAAAVTRAPSDAPAAQEEERAAPIRVVARYGAAELHVGGRRLHLTRAEWQLFRALADSHGETLTRSELASRAWGSGYSNRCGEVEVYVCRLRRKLADGAAGREWMIETVRGVGYRFNAPPGLLERSEDDAADGER